MRSTLSFKSPARLNTGNHTHRVSKKSSRRVIDVVVLTSLTAAAQHSQFFKSFVRVPNDLYTSQSARTHVFPVHSSSLDCLSYD